MQTFFEGPFENGLFRGEEWKNRSAMVVVPHQDDEINLAGATIRNLVQNHVRVYVVFCTTCDRLEPAEMRAAEGIRSCRSLGVQVSSHQISFSASYREPVSVTPRLAD